MHSWRESQQGATRLQHDLGRSLLANMSALSLRAARTQELKKSYYFARIYEAVSDPWCAAKACLLSHGHHAKQSCPERSSCCFQMV